MCNCCIERLDHHCPWLGTCVGKRNYKYFFMFIWALFLMIVTEIIFSVIFITGNQYNEITTQTDEIPSFSTNQIISIVNSSLTALLGLFVFYLFGYHQFLLCRNETTNEHLKGSYSKFPNPFQKGCIDNIKRICRKDKRNWKPEQVIVKEEKGLSDSVRAQMEKSKGHKKRGPLQRMTVGSSNTNK